jgi:hypothetical protein
MGGGSDVAALNFKLEAYRRPGYAIANSTCMAVGGSLPGPIILAARHRSPTATQIGYCVAPLVSSYGSCGYLYDDVQRIL